MDRYGSQTDDTVFTLSEDRGNPRVILEGTERGTSGPEGRDPWKTFVEGPEGLE